MVVPGGFIAEMIAHAREVAPNECCGIIAGQDGRAVELFRVKNADVSPYRYSMDPPDVSRIYRQCDSKGWEFLAIYHSHPASEAYPSPTDIRLAFWPDALYLIISLMHPDLPVVRAFHIVDGAVREASGPSLTIGPAESRRMHAPRLFPTGGALCVGTALSATQKTWTGSYVSAAGSRHPVVSSVWTAHGITTILPSYPSGCSPISASTFGLIVGTASSIGALVTTGWRHVSSRIGTVTSFLTSACSSYVRRRRPCVRSAA